jgi:hypothetical protein
LHPLLNRLGVGPNADIASGVWLRAEDETKRPDLMQALFHHPVPGNSEVCRGDVERLAA